MGWLGKLLAFLLAIILFGVGLWEITLLIFAWLFIPPILKSRTGKGGSQGSSKPSGKFPVRYFLGGFLLLLAVLGNLAHGTFSPFVFGSLGVLVILWGRIPMSLMGSMVNPVKDSILLRSTPVPVSWTAVAEVKPLTRDIGRALAGVTGTVLVSASDKPSIYVVVEMRALSERSAENAMLEALRQAAISLTALGAYLLPLDSKQALGLLQPTLQAANIERADWSNALASGSYDVLYIRQDKGFAKSLGIYRKVDRGREGRGSVPPSSREFAHPPFLMEVFKAVGSRLTWPNPDQYTAFLSSLFATSSEPIGTRILDAGAASQSQAVLVRSQGSPPVELSRAQTQGRRQDV